MQKEFVTPFNSTSHTSPPTETDIKILRDYLEALCLQTYHPERENNFSATEARDLIQSGSDYANTSSAYQNFNYTKYDYKNEGLPEGVPSLPQAETDFDENEAVDDYCKLDGDEAVNFDDLLLDEEEYPMGSDVGDYLAVVHEVIDELGCYS